jgi:predicted RNA binding protein YcfA (HicA-like mRNA interferase family)
MGGSLPALTGKQLIRLFLSDGWEDFGRRTHGIALAKRDASGCMRITIIPDKPKPLPGGTLAAILGPKQSDLGRDGLANLIERFGVR